MKKNNRIASIVLATLVALALIVSCDTGTTADKEEEAPKKATLTNEFATYWIEVAESGLPSGVEGFHLKNLGTETVGIIIDKIVAAESRSMDGAVTIFEFDDPESGSMYWGFDAGTIADGVWSSGEIAAPEAPEVEVYSTGFATPGFVDKTWIGVVAKNLSETVSGNKMTFVPIAGEPMPDAAQTFEDLFKY